MGKIFVVWGVVFLVGCSSDEAVICEKLDECNLIRAGVSVEECEEEIEKTMSEGQRSDCAECAEDKSCESITNGACNADCGL